MTRKGRTKEPEANSWPQEHKRVARQPVAGEQASTRKAQNQQTTGCRTRRHERKDCLLTQGEPALEREQAVSRGHSSEEARPKPGQSEGPKNERTKLDEKLEPRTEQSSETAGRGNYGHHPADEAPPWRCRRLK